MCSIKIGLAFIMKEGLDKLEYCNILTWWPVNYFGVNEQRLWIPKHNVTSWNWQTRKKYQIFLLSRNGYYILTLILMYIVDKLRKHWGKPRFFRIFWKIEEYCHNPTQQQLNLTRLRLDITIKPTPPQPPTQTIQDSYWSRGLWNNRSGLLIGRELVQPKIEASHWLNSYSYH